MDRKHETQAVSAAASLIATAISILKHSGESIGIGIRTEAERSLQRLGPDHKVEPLSAEALRGFLVDKYGEDFAVDVVDNNAPAVEPPPDNGARFDKLERLMGQQADENARLRAELDALKAAKPAEDKKAKPAESKPA